MSELHSAPEPEDLALLLFPIVGKFVGFFLPSGVEETKIVLNMAITLCFLSEGNYKNKWASKSDPVT